MSLSCLADLHAFFLFEDIYSVKEDPLILVLDLSRLFNVGCRLAYVLKVDALDDYLVAGDSDF
jgi:hypothetical protein